MNKHDVDVPEVEAPFSDTMDLLDRRLAYTLFRLAAGAYLLHGATYRFEGAGAFPRPPLDDLAPALAPLLTAGLAFLAAGLGLLLVLGLWTRGALVAGGALVTALMLAAAPRTDARMLMVQMFCLGVFYLLPPAAPYNVFSADALRGKFAAARRGLRDCTGRSGR